MPVTHLVVIDTKQPLSPAAIEDPTVGLMASLDVAERVAARRRKVINAVPVAPASQLVNPESLCVFEQLAWVPTTSGVLTIREVYERAHEIEGLSPRLNGAEYSSVIRLLASLSALLCRTDRGVRIPSGRFDAADIDRLAAMVRPHMDLFHSTRPFLQRHHEGDPKFKFAKPAILYPWKQSEGSDLFYDRAESSGALDLPAAVLALSVYSTHSVAQNPKIGEISQGFGSPGLQASGSYPAVEVMFAGDNLFETLLVTTPRDWVTGGGLPAWMDRWCTQSSTDGEPMTMWRQTWAPNQAIAKWNPAKTQLVKAAAGGGLPLPPGLAVAQDPPGAGEENKPARQTWINERKTFVSSRAHEDPFYLWALEPLRKPKGDQTHRMVAHRPVMGYTMGEALASWHKSSAAKALHDCGRRFVVEADLYNFVTFISHVTGGSDMSSQVRSSVVRQEKKSTWISKAVHGESLAAASETLMAVSRAVTQPWINFQTVGMKIRATRLFWTAISAQTRTFFADPESVNRQEYWRAVRNAALESFDRTSSLLGVGVGGHRIEAERARLVNVLRKILVNHL